MQNTSNQQIIEDKINQANQATSKSYCKFINEMNEIRKLMPITDRHLLDEKLSALDNIFHDITNVQRRYLRTFITANIKELMAQDEIDAVQEAKDIAEAQKLMGIANTTAA